jgi:hypothetical protein
MAEGEGNIVNRGVNRAADFAGMVADSARNDKLHAKNHLTRLAFGMGEAPWQVIREAANAVATVTGGRRPLANRK